VVDVGVGEENATDGCAEGAGGGEDVIGGVGEVGVDEGEAVGFADEVTVDEAKASELVAVGRDRCRSHLGLDAAAWRGIKFRGEIGWDISELLISDPNVRSSVRVAALSPCIMSRDKLGAESVHDPVRF
jgi:hypothetical protein